MKLSQKLTRYLAQNIFIIITLASQPNPLSAQQPNSYIDPYSLPIGGIYITTEEIPLMSELAPKDPFAAMQKTIYLPAGTKIEIVEISNKYPSPWYFVNTFPKQEKSQLVTGWINSIALIGEKLDVSKK
ncbi:MAG TPA: hypothetical protein VD713_06785 [Sphingomonadales bacterium]|nr:hypothetical protein [Sphingomonadales bacterium]